MQVITQQLFKISDLVEKSGMYVCVPCGYMQYFEAGSQFTVCVACLAGTPDGPAGFQSPLSEFWQFMG